MEKPKPPVVPKADIVNEVITGIEGEYGKGSVMTLGEDGVFCEISHWIPTGATLLDLAIYRGIPSGRLTEIHGDPSTGKSVIAASIIAKHQQSGGVAVLLDTENGFMPEYAAKIGVNIDKLIYAQPVHLQECLGMMELSINRVKVSKDPRPLLIVWDSVAATPTREEVEGDFGASHMGLHARLLSQAMRKLTGIISKERVAIVVINQSKTALGVTFGDAVTTLGGQAIPFHAAVRVRLDVVSKLKDATGNVYGIIIDAYVNKNKVAPPFKRARLHFEFDRGFVDEATWIEFLAVRGLIQRKGSWYYLPNMDPNAKNTDGTPATINVQYGGYLKKLQEDPAYKEFLRQLVINNYHKKLEPVSDSQEN